MDATPLDTTPARASGNDPMIEHTDAALAAWLAETGAEVSFEGVGDDTPATSVIELRLHRVAERVSQRDNDARDRRDQNGTVIERQRADRHFDIDYLCAVRGPHPEAHRVLGAVIQLFVDHDRIPERHIGQELDQIGQPIEARLVTNGPSATAAAADGGLAIQVVVPFRPTPERDIAPPAVEFHLDVGPPPGADVAIEPDASDDAGANADLLDRQWTRLRRREHIGRTPSREET